MCVWAPVSMNVVLDIFAFAFRFTPLPCLCAYYIAGRCYEYYVLRVGMYPMSVNLNDYE